MKTRTAHQFAATYHNLKERSSTMFAHLPHLNAGRAARRLLVAGSVAAVLALSSLASPPGAAHAHFEQEFYVAAGLCDVYPYYLDPRCALIKQHHVEHQREGFSRWWLAEVQYYEDLFRANPGLGSLVAGAVFNRFSDPSWAASFRTFAD